HRRSRRGPGPDGAPVGPCRRGWPCALAGGPVVRDGRRRGRGAAPRDQGAPGRGRAHMRGPLEWLDRRIGVPPPEPGEPGDPGLFGSGSTVWRIGRERALLLGGPAGLLMQIAHPLLATAAG